MADLSSIYRDKSPSAATKATLAALHLGIVLLVLWLLFAGGGQQVATALGTTRLAGNPARLTLLAGAAVLYLGRTLMTLFLFMKRRMPWSEVFTIAAWIGLIDLLFAYYGGGNASPLGAWGGVAVGLILVGSALNTGAEWQRKRWKARPENRGRLYTGGLFGLSRHVNYFGDVVLFTGWALLAGGAWLLVIPAAMTAGFVFVNIPALDRYLAKHYPDEFPSYAKSVSCFVPFVY